MPAAAASIYSGVTFPDGDVSFADEVVAYNVGDRVLSPYNDPQNALGAPSGLNSNSGFFSLGLPTTGSTNVGFITVKFTDNSLTTSGNDDADLFIFEIGSAVERYKVEISKNNSSWITIGDFIGQPGKLDIDAVSGVSVGDQFSYVRVTDVPGGAISGSPFGGPDIAAVGAISSAPPVPAVPLPAAGWALLTGFAALFGLRRRKS